MSDPFPQPNLPLCGEQLSHSPLGSQPSAGRGWHPEPLPCSHTTPSWSKQVSSYIMLALAVLAQVTGRLWS